MINWKIPISCTLWENSRHLERVTRTMLSIYKIKSRLRRNKGFGNVRGSRSMESHVLNRGYTVKWIASRDLSALCLNKPSPYCNTVRQKPRSSWFILIGLADYPSDKTNLNSSIRSIWLRSLETGELSRSLIKSFRLRIPIQDRLLHDAFNSRQIRSQGTMKV